MKKIFMFAVCAMILTACTTKEEEVSPASQDVRFYPTMTRATETQFQEGDKISISAVHPSAGTELKASGNYADNVKYVYRGGWFVAESASEAIKLNDDAGLAYYGVYPQQYSLATNGTFKVQTDQRTRANITASDLCTVYRPVSNDREVYLKFWHRLSRICVNIEGVPDGKTVTMRLTNIYNEAFFDLNANTYSTAPGAIMSEIRMGEMNGSNRDFEAILPPQAFTLGTNLIVTIGGTSYNVRTSRPTETFRSGMEYDYKLRYNGGIIEFVFRGYIHPWNTGELSEVVGGREMENNLREWMPIYDGNTPPNIEGCYFVDPYEAVYCQDYGNGGYAPGKIVNSIYCQFLNQNSITGKIDFNSVSVTGSETAEGRGAFINGSGNNFTAFFNTNGIEYGISTKRAVVISGTKTSDGIKDLYYAFVMVEKGDDPNHQLMNEGVFRVFRDKDFLAVNATWPGEGGIIVVGDTRSAAKGFNNPGECTTGGNNSQRQ